MKDLIKKLAIFLVVFTIIAVGITYGLIQGKISELSLSHNNNIDQQNKPEPPQSGEIILKEEKGIDLYGVYDQNDLIINESVELHNTKEIKIPQIDGLKNLDVQNKINNEMYDQIIASITELSNINYSYYNVTGNFANVLSINFYAYDTNNNSVRLYFNYKLTDGTKLKFEDIFAQCADITSIVRGAFYSTLARDNYWDVMGDAWDEDLVAYPDENKLYKIVKGFMELEDKEFSLSPSGLAINHNNAYADIEFVNVAEDIVIYDKYMTGESLYIRDDIGFANIFTCANANYDYFDSIEYGYLEDNYWFDITVNESYGEDELSGEKLEKFKELKDKLYQESLDAVNEYMKKAKENPDKFYIVLARPEASLHGDWEYDENGESKYVFSNFANTNVNIITYEMPLTFFHDTFKDTLIAAYRSNYIAMNGGVYLYINSDNKEVITQEDRNSRIYNYVTGEQLEKLTDLFYEDSGYMDVIKEKIAFDLFKHYDGYTMDEANALVENVVCKIAVDSIVVTIPSIPNYEGIVYFFQFEDEMFKIMK